ncbi:MAG: HAD-IA family hydrolase [Anaerolineae bacterium]|nr:HAD-IA family hydrolase [Anaerolineae bacterium]
MQLLIWDFDGTLGYREGGAWTASLYEVVERYAGGVSPAGAVTYEALQPYTRAGFPWQTPEESHAHLNTPDRWWTALAATFVHAYRGVGYDPETAQDLARRVRATYLDPTRWRRFDDAAPALDALSAAGWTHVLLTNHVPELPDILRAVGLAGYFAAIFNSADLGYEKPHPRTFETVLAETGDGAEAAWMIGDSYHADVLGAEAAGIPAILVRRPHPGAKRFAEDLEDVVAMLA